MNYENVDPGSIEAAHDSANTQSAAAEQASSPEVLLINTLGARIRKLHGEVSKIPEDTGVMVDETVGIPTANTPEEAAASGPRVFLDHVTEDNGTRRVTGYTALAKLDDAGNTTQLSVRSIDRTPGRPTREIYTSEVTVTGWVEGSMSSVSVTKAGDLSFELEAAEQAANGILDVIANVTGYQRQLGEQAAASQQEV